MRALILFLLTALISHASTVTATIGQSALFTVVVGAGTPPYTYQWKKDGADIPGATGSSYTINKVSTTDAGAYTVTISNSGGSTTSDYGVLSVVAVDTSKSIVKAQLPDLVTVQPGAFTPLKLQASRDPGGHYDNVTGLYTVDSDGDYEIVMHARPVDVSSPLVSWGLYAGIQDADTPDLLWLSTNQAQPGTGYTRNGGLNVIVIELKAGAKVRMGVYVTYLPLLFINADFTIRRL